FQAEDGIRDRNVTGVQTCALPIYFQIETISLPTQTRKKPRTYWGKASAKQCSPPKAKIKRLRIRHTKSKTCHSSQSATHCRNLRSEERRVGKESRSRGGRRYRERV